MQYSGQRSMGKRNGGPSKSPCGGPLAPTRDSSPRQLPTNHDHVGESMTRSTNIRLINRRDRFVDRCPLYWTRTTEEHACGFAGGGEED